MRSWPCFISYRDLPTRRPLSDAPLSKARRRDKDHIYSAQHYHTVTLLQTPGPAMADDKDFPDFRSSYRNSYYPPRAMYATTAPVCLQVEVQVIAFASF